MNMFHNFRRFREKNDEQKILLKNDEQKFFETPKQKIRRFKNTKMQQL